jgi:hypothetical protein
MDFQLVIPHKAKNPIPINHNFYVNPYSMGAEGRPTLLKPYNDKKEIDNSTEQLFYNMPKPCLALNCGT